MFIPNFERNAVTYPLRTRYRKTKKKTTVTQPSVTMVRNSFSRRFSIAETIRTSITAGIAIRFMPIMKKNMQAARSLRRVVFSFSVMRGAKST